MLARGDIAKYRMMSSSSDPLLTWHEDKAELELEDLVSCRTKNAFHYLLILCFPSCGTTDYLSCPIAGQRGTMLKMMPKWDSSFASAIIQKYETITFHIVQKVQGVLEQMWTCGLGHERQPSNNWTTLLWISSWIHLHFYDFRHLLYKID